MASPIIHDATQETGYLVERNGLLAMGKHAAEGVGEYLGHLVESVIGSETVNTISVFAGAFRGIGGLLAIGLTAAVSAALTQMDYVHRKDGIAEDYKEELAAKLRKPANKIRGEDLEIIAKQNATLAEELNRARKQRNYGLGLSFMASMASLLVIKLVVPVLMAAMGFSMAPAGLTLAYAGTMALSMGVGLITYNAAKAPLHAIANRLFGIDDKTANDHIIAMVHERKAGKIITRQQVLSFFVAANPPLAQFIVTQYGKHYDDLAPEVQQLVAKDLGASIPLDKLTQDINSNKINPTELAFVAEGQTSGVDKRHLQHEGKEGLLKTFFSGMVKPPVHMKSKTSPKIADPADLMALMETHENPAVASAAVVQKSTGRSFVEALEQSRSEPSLASGPTHS